MKTHLLNRTYAIVLIILVLMLANCGSQNTQLGEATGSISATLVWTDANGNSIQSAGEKHIATAPPGVVTVRIIVTASDMNAIQKDFAASVGQGLIEGIPAGTNRTFTAQGLDSGGTVKFQGAIGNVTIQAGQTTDVGIVFLSQVNDTTPPSVPTGLTVTAVSPSQINLSWNASTDPDDAVAGYRIYRSGTLLTTVSATSTSDTGLSPSTQYCYAVSAYDTANNESGKSSQACATTNSAITQPVAPSSLAATAISSSRIALTWQDNSTNEDGFKIERKTGSGGTYSQIGTVGPIAGSGSGGYYEDATVAASTTYCYRVKAYNSVGDSGYSNENCVTTPAPPCATPTVTTGSATNITTNSATLNGTVNPGGVSTGAFFQWGTSAFYGNLTSSQFLGSGTSNVAVTAALPGLSPNTTYHFRIVATNSCGGTVFGSDQTFTTASGSTGLAPTATTGSATNVTSNSATLNGTVNPNGLPTDVWFRYGTTPSYGSATPMQSIGSGTSSISVSQSLTGLSPSTTYYFQIVAYNSAGTTYGTSPQIFTTSSAGKAVTVANTSGIGLNLRNCASTGCSVITSLPEGTQMNVIGGPVQAEGYTWWNITGTPGTGWSGIGEWLTPSPQVGVTVTVAYTGGSGLRLRNCASTSCSLVTTLPEGTQMNVFNGPTQAGGYTWWALQGHVGSTLYTGWSAVGNWLVPNPRY